MSIIVRSETPADAAEIEALTVSAFRDAPHTGHTEQFIVRELRRAGQLTVSLVAEESGKVIGHVAVSPVTVSDGSPGWYGLGPISVLPERHGEGIGSRLMEGALAELRRLDAAGCVLVGEPAFYGRFGFRADDTLVLPDVPPQYFQAIRLDQSTAAGTVTYHEAFKAAQ